VNKREGRTLDVEVWRGNATGGSFSTYTVPEQASQTVLDVVTWIQQNAEPALTYRFACRVGMCGSCAMMVNGTPRWTCRTHVRKVTDGNRLRIAPLRNLPVIKDLATDMTTFFDKWTRAEGVFHPSQTRADPIAPISPDEPQRARANAAIECINCAICYSACDTVTANPAYLGPAALNRAWTLQNDVRDSAYAPRQAAVSSGGGCFNCHSHQSCMTYCPNELNPTGSIAGLKRLAWRGLIKGVDRR
jgi:succinate dehydrogenase iron-sulfur subunit